MGKRGRATSRCGCGRRRHATSSSSSRSRPTVEDLTGRRDRSRARGGRLPDRRVGRREPRLPRVRRGPRRPASARRCWPPGSACARRRREVLGQGLVRAVWTDDEAPPPGSTRRSPTTPARPSWPGHPGGPGGPQGGRRGRRRRPSSAGRCQLAHESGNEDTAKLLAKVVDVVDAATGTVRLKAKVEDADEMALDTRSTKTVRIRRAGP